MRIVLSIAIGVSLVLVGGTASAGRMKPVNPAMLCVPSEQAHVATTSSSGSLCLLTLAPLFSKTSFEFTPTLALTPRAVPKRWGAEFELRF
jgi:hypothetical protein